jgi:hypothetical protein
MRVWRSETQERKKRAHQRHGGQREQRGRERPQMPRSGAGGGRKAPALRAHACRSAGGTPSPRSCLASAACTRAESAACTGAASPPPMQLHGTKAPHGAGACASRRVCMHVHMQAACRCMQAGMPAKQRCYTAMRACMVVASGCRAPVDCHRALLTKAPRALSCLNVSAGVPVRVIEQHTVRGGEVDAQATHPRREQEHKDALVCPAGTAFTTCTCKPLYRGAAGDCISNSPGPRGNRRRRWWQHQLHHSLCTAADMAARRPCRRRKCVSAGAPQD